MSEAALGSPIFTSGLCQPTGHSPISLAISPELTSGTSGPYNLPEITLENRARKFLGLREFCPWLLGGKHQLRIRPIRM